MAEGTGDIEIGTAPNENPSRTRENCRVAEEYGSKLKTLRRAALLPVALRGFCRFAGFCSLTWALTVIFGAFAQSLTAIDFFLVFALLLVEAIRLALSTVSARRSLVQKYLIITCEFLFYTLVLVTHYLKDKNQYRRLTWSLRIFYTVLLLNAIASACCGISSVVILSLFVTSYSHHKYYIKVVSSGIKGILNSDDSAVFSFAFKVQSDEYRRRIGALAVLNLYRDLITYLFCHEEGLEAALIALDSNDFYEKKAAANIVGLWTRCDDPDRRILGLQRRLLTKLANIVDNGELGWAATSSFQLLAMTDPETVVEVKNESREKLVDVLIHNIRHLVRARRYDSTSTIVKTLIPLLENDICREQLMGNALLPELAKNLSTVFSNNCLKRSKAIAGYALRKIDPAAPTPDEVTRFLRVPEVKAGGEYVLDDEEKYLVELLESEEWPSEWRVLPNDLKVRHDELLQKNVAFSEAHKEENYVNLWRFMTICQGFILFISILLPYVL